MKIAFDHQIFMLQSYGGISRYIVRLADELAKLNQEVKIIAPFHCNRYVGGLPASSVQGREVKNIHPKIIRFSGPLNRHLCERDLGRFAPKILHETYYTSHSISVSGAKRVLTVHDMIHERFPDFFSKFDKTSIAKRNAVERADHIICISHNTKNDLCEMFAISPEKVSVVHHGYESFPKDKQDAHNVNMDRPFVLFVGQRSGYKNFKRMLSAVGSHRELREAFDIIAFGGQAFSAFEIDLIRSCRLRPGSVRQVNGSDSVLGRLYKNASAFIYPSLYEGFGLPLLEAMAHDCPVVSSNTSSMPEIAGHAAEYFSPMDVDEQAQAISNVVFDSSRRESLVNLGKERLTNYSWRKCAENTLDVYGKVLV